MANTNERKWQGERKMIETERNNGNMRKMENKTSNGNRKKQRKH